MYQSQQAWWWEYLRFEYWCQREWLEFSVAQGDRISNRSTSMLAILLVRIWYLSCWRHSTRYDNTTSVSVDECKFRTRKAVCGIGWLSNASIGGQKNREAYPPGDIMSETLKFPKNWSWQITVCTDKIKAIVNCVIGVGLLAMALCVNTKTRNTPLNWRLYELLWCYTTVPWHKTQPPICKTLQQHLLCY